MIINCKAVVKNNTRTRVPIKQNYYSPKKHIYKNIIFTLFTIVDDVRSIIWIEV